MIRKLQEQDRQQTMDFLSVQASKNLFIIGDIETYGFQQDFQELWGEFDEHEVLIAVMLRYYESFILYSPSIYGAKDFMDIILTYEKPAVSGDGKVLEQMKPYMDEEIFRLNDTFFAECTKASLKTDSLDSGLKNQIQILTKDDIPELVTMRNEIKEFNIMGTVEEQIERFENDLKNKAGRTYFVREDSKIVSAVSTSAENRFSAMIVGVCTLPQYRNKGYVSTLMGKMMHDIFEEKGTVCLFYDNPAAGAIYKRIGFYDIGIWRLYRNRETLGA